jgi:Fe-S-cluster containining protein
MNEGEVGKKLLIHTNYSVCMKCKGKCCTTESGAYAPEDFNQEITIDLIVSLLMTKRITIDYYDDEVGDGKQYYLRPRYLDEDVLKPSISGGTCVNWNLQTGCSLSESERPYQCRALVPFKDGLNCKTNPNDMASVEEISKLWRPYRMTINRAIDEFNRVRQFLTVNEHGEFFGKGVLEQLSKRLIKYKEVSRYQKFNELNKGVE